MPETLEKSKATIKEIFALIDSEMKTLDERLLNISVDSRILSGVVKEVFNAGGKRVRPAICFLVYKALLEEFEAKDGVEEKVFLAAELTELIHSASLVHDDIIDNSLVRRGLGTVNSKWDNAITVISGDFMFARAAVNLGALECNEVVKLYASVLELLCDGEIEQVEKKFNTEIDWEYYFRKNHKKTGSLIEAPAKAPACLLGLDEKVKDAMASYGKNLGAAFQVVDDILDYTSDEETLGKPAGSDLKEGHLTAPALYALEELKEKNAAAYKQLIGQIQELGASAQIGFEENKADPKLLENILVTVKSTAAIQKSKAKALELAQEAISELALLKDSKYKKALSELALYVVNRDF